MRTDLEIGRALAFLSGVRRAALRRLHELSRLRESLGASAGRTGAALDVMRRSIAAVGEVAEDELDGLIALEPVLDVATRRAP